MAYRVLNASFFSTYNHGLGISQILNQNVRLLKHKDALESATLSKKRVTKQRTLARNAIESEQVPFINMNTQSDDLLRVKTVSNLTEIEEPILDNDRQIDTFIARPRTAHPRRSRTSIEDDLSLFSSNSEEDLTVDRWGRPITQNVEPVYVQENISVLLERSKKGTEEVKQKIENMPLDFGGKIVD